MILDRWVRLERERTNRKASTYEGERDKAGDDVGCTLRCGLSTGFFFCPDETFLLFAQSMLYVVHL